MDKPISSVAAETRNLNASALAAKMLVIAGYLYLFLPSLTVLAPTGGMFVFPVEGSGDSLVIWNIYEGIFYTDLSGRRAVLQMLLRFGSDLTHLSPWQFWQIVVITLAPISVYLTYRFVKHFHEVTPFQFLVCTLAVPFWAIAVQYPHESAISYALFISAAFLATRSKPYLVASAILSVFAFLIRPDALAVFGIVLIVIWIDRQTLKQKITDCTLFAVLFFVIGSIGLAQFDYTFIRFVTMVLHMGAGYSNIDWLGDTTLKIFTVNSIILLPFYIWKTVVDIKRKGIVSTLWPLVPIIVFGLAYYNKLNLPRYVMYTAPFIIYIVHDTAMFAIYRLRQLPVLHWRPVIPALIIVLLFNPSLHIKNRNANSSNFVEWVSTNYNEKHIYSYLHTGLLPYLNFHYKTQYAQCFGYLTDIYRDFLAGPKQVMAIFVYGGDSENFVHQLALQAFFNHFDIRYGEDSIGKNLPIKKTTKTYKTPKTYWPHHEAIRFSHKNKDLLLIKMRNLMEDRKIYIEEDIVLRRFLSEPLNADIPPEKDFYKIISFNMRTAPYPEYLKRENHCWIRDPHDVKALSVGFPDGNRE